MFLLLFSGFSVFLEMFVLFVRPVYPEKRIKNVI